MNYFNYYYCFLTITLLIIATCTNSYAQKSIGETASTTETPEMLDYCEMDFTEQVCENGFLKWTPIPNTLFYEIHVPNETGTFTAFTIVSTSEISEVALNILRPLPDNPDETSSYEITIIPIASNCDDLSLTGEYIYIENLCNTSSSNGGGNGHKTTDGSPTGDGGSNGFAALIDSGDDKIGSGKISYTNSLQSTNQFTITPNPVQNYLTLNTEITQNQQLSIQLYNSSGQLVRQLSNNQFYNKGSHILSYDMTDLVEGIYYCAIKNGQNDQTIVKKLIKL